VHWIFTGGRRRRGEWHIPAGTPSVMHQRMGFYVAPDGRLLTLAFYGYSPTPRIGPNNGQGLGRVVREIREDGSLGPIYFGGARGRATARLL